MTVAVHFVSVLFSRWLLLGCECPAALSFLPELGLPRAFLRFSPKRFCVFSGRMKFSVIVITQRVFHFS
ncbi:hypothetical protein [Polycladidibacter stylochi]|uniref:hypothetical protein n=1 Tax=Polycladidibacter stylochi TaxID=1807766 RepID=UPI0012E3988D|nr:hypothetical protein [Pseudovibrio stylochi]